jgi:hypothetical protein
MMDWSRTLQSFAFLLAPVLTFSLAITVAGWLGLDVSIRSDWFDTAHYLHIKNDGYLESWRTAFFPGFPFFWRALDVGVISIALVNALLWAVAMVFLRLSGTVQSTSLWLAALAPSALFFFIPYSESLFLFACVPVVIGLQRRTYALTIVGVLLAALIRPTAAVLIPALFFARWYRDKQLKKAFVATLPEAFAGLIAVAGVFTVHFRATGEWFTFFTAQRAWGNGVGFPDLPLSTYGGDIIMLLDGAALFVGLSAGVTVLRQAFGRRRLRSEHVFGMTALAVTALLILFSRGGGIFSINRFIFATLFFPLALDGWRRLRVYRIDLFGFIGAWLVFSLAIGSYMHIRALLVCLGTGALIALVFGALSNKNTRVLASFVLLAVSVFFICYFYLRGNWIG